MADSDEVKIQVKITRQENAEYFKAHIGDIVPVAFYEYIWGVVASEIGNSDFEACKAQAVAARTFAVLKGVLNGKAISDSSSTDQAFRAKRCNSDSYPNALLATVATAREILTYNGKPISAVYSACNGGRTVSAKERWGSDRPYLPAQDDPWDNSTKRTGHGVGMSQRGAKAMAVAGKTYRDILAFYYPGTEIIELEGTGEQKEAAGMVNAEAFLEKVMIPYKDGWGYIYGTWGKLWTEADQKRLNQTTDSNRAMSRKYGSKWIGKNVADCSGLVRWAMYQLGVEVAHHATYLYTDYCKNKGRLAGGKRSDGEELLPGSLVFVKGNREKIHHVGVYIGDGEVIEAKGAQYGVIKSSVTERWDYWGELKSVDYTNQSVTEVVPMRTAVVNTKGKVLNMRMSESKGAPLICQIPKGETVQVLDMENPKWYQIKYGSHVGWASTEFLILQDEKVPEPAEPEIGLEDICNAIRASLNGLSEEIDHLEKMVDQLK